VTVTWELALKPAPVMVSLTPLLPALHEAGETPVIVVGWTRVSEVVAVTAGVPTLATMLTLAVLELVVKSGDDEAGAL